MLVGGLAAGHVGMLCAVAMGSLLGQPNATLSALIGGALVIVFFSVGQAVELVAVTMASMMGLVATLFSYLVRMILLGVSLSIVLRIGGGRVGPEWVFCGVVCTVIGWVTGVVVVAARQRVPVFDHDYQPPPGWDEGQ